MSYDNNGPYLIKTRWLRESSPIIIFCLIGILIVLFFVREPLVSLIENAVWFINPFTNPSATPIPAPVVHF
jgi:hypothetical protein